VNGEGKGVRKGMLNLIDLAGSERLKKSGSQDNPALLRETQNINLSLSALGNVIAALGEGAPHVPFRDSKLTALLEGSLGGDSKCLMFCCLAPETDHLLYWGCGDGCFGCGGRGVVVYDHYSLCLCSKRRLGKSTVC